MKWKELVTLTFDKNVGPKDRVFRLVSGLALMAVGWYAPLPLWGAIGTSIAGLMWTATGVLSRCSIYYLVGYSTCPVSDQRRRSGLPP